MNDLLKRMLATVRGLPASFMDLARRMRDAHMSEAAAAMAYYAFFSLLPLLVVLVAASSLLIESPDAYRSVIDFVSGAFPASRGLIEQNVQQVIRLRGPVGAVGLVGLLWSASGFFSALVHNIDRARGVVSPRSYLQRRLWALGIVVVLAVLVLSSLAADALMERMPSWLPLGRVTLFGESPWALFSRLTPWLSTYLMFLSLYRWIPSTSVSWRGVLWGAAVAMVLWQAGGRLFVWYLDTGLARYDLVYGSLGAVAVLLLWIYLSSWLVLAGAHLTAVISQRR